MITMPDHRDEVFLAWWMALTPEMRLQHARSETVTLTSEMVIKIAALDYRSAIRYSAAASAWGWAWLALRSTKEVRRAALSVGAWLSGKRL